VDSEEKSLLWKIAILSFVVGIAGAVVGGLFTFYGSYWAWNQQQQALNEQKLLEQQNIALALYIDVSSIEDKLNSSMHTMLSDTHNNISKLDDPNYVYYTNARFNSINWIYTTFGKEISGFDSITSAELYDFYENVAEIDDYMQFLHQIGQSGEQISQMDFAEAHTYTKGLFGIKIPDCIQEAEKIKQALRQKYHLNIVITPSNKQVDTSFSLKIDRTNGSRALDINYH